MSSQLLEDSILAGVWASGWLDSVGLLLTPDRLSLKFRCIPATEEEAC